MPVSNTCADRRLRKVWVRARRRRILVATEATTRKADWMRKAGSAGIGAAVAVLGLIPAAAAGADTIKHEGSISGRPAAKVKFAVKKDDGQLQKVTNLRFNRVPVTCEDGNTGAVTARAAELRPRRQGEVHPQGQDRGSRDHRRHPEGLREAQEQRQEGSGQRPHRLQVIGGLRLRHRRPQLDDEQALSESPRSPA